MMIMVENELLFGNDLFMVFLQMESLRKSNKIRDAMAIYFISLYAALQRISKFITVL